jgi:hypothetical protein
MCAACKSPERASPAASACLEREPATVALVGVIERATFPGLPNYESIAKGDAEESCWILKLDQPVCLAASVNPSGEIDDKARRGVRAIQLVFEGSDGYQIYRDLVGQRVHAAGGLFAAFSRHHHAEVLMTVDDLTRAAAAPASSASR